MRIPHISSTHLDSGFEASCAIRVASLLASDLLKDTHYGYAETKECNSFSKLNPKHLQNARELLLSSLASLTEATFEMRIAVQPDLLHKAQGEIDMHFVIRCGGDTDALARERVAETFLSLMPVLVSLIPEADLKLVHDEESLGKCMNPFQLNHAAAVVRRRQDIRLASEVSSNAVGFLPSKGNSGKFDNEVISHILPWIPTHDDWGRLLDALTGQLDPCMLLVRITPHADVVVERDRVLKIVELCEAVLAGLDANDLALRKQVSMLAEQCNARLEFLNNPCFDVGALLISSSRISQPLTRFVGGAISGNRMGGDEPAWLQGGFSVRPLESDEFMQRCFYPDDDAPFSLGEAACAFRLPSPPNRDIPGLNIQRFKTSLAMLPQYDNGNKESIRLFVNEYQGLCQPVLVEADDRARHAFILGQTGTGKSSLMESMIVQDIKAGRGLAVIDPHGDMIDTVLSRIPIERAEDVILFDFLDRERPLAFNVLQWSDIAERDLIIDDIYRTLDHIYDMKETGGPIFEQHFRNMMKLLMGDRKRTGFTPTLLEFIRCYTDREFRHWLLESIGDQQVKDFISEAESADRDVSLRNIAPYITSKFGRFVNDTTLKRIVGQEKSSFDFDEIMNKGKILLVKLGKGRFGGEVSALLANMLVSRFQHSAMKRGEMPKDERRDFYLYCDEAHNLPQENFSELFAEARKYRLGLILATQYCSQLGNVSGGRGDDLLAAIFGNVGTLITFRTGAQDAEHLARGFMPSFNQLDIMSLPNYHGYARMNLKGQSTLPFSFRTELDTSPMNEELAGRLRTLSRLKYGMDVNIVEAEIFRRQECWKNPVFSENSDKSDEPSETSPTEEEETNNEAELFSFDFGDSAIVAVDEEKPLDYILDVKEMSVRLKLVLDRNNLRTIGDVTALTGAELLKKGLGLNTLNEIKAIVEKHGWSIKES
jgi:DNA helicase HerA-like ATPase